MLVMRFLMIVMLSLVAGAGCVADQAADTAPSRATPDGTWDVVLSWSDIQCGQPVDTLATLVTVDGDSTVIDGIDGAAATGTASCGPDGCELALDESWPIDHGLGQVTLHLEATSGSDGAIAGSGTAVVKLGDAHICHKTFVASGQRGFGVVSLQDGSSS